MKSTLADDDKFTRFARAVFGAEYSSGKEGGLKKKFRNVKDDLVERQRVNRPPRNTVRHGSTPLAISSTR